VPCQQGQQIRNKYADWRMMKDVKRRKTLKEFGAERMRINSLRKNDILPQELRVKYNLKCVDYFC
jgi:small subunit ribosomal protein S14